MNDFKKKVYREIFYKTRFDVSDQIKRAMLFTVDWPENIEYDQVEPNLSDEIHKKLYVDIYYKIRDDLLNTELSSAIIQIVNQK